MIRSAVFTLLGILLAVLTNPITRSAFPNKYYILIPIVAIGDILHIAILLGLMTFQFWFTFQERDLDLIDAWYWSTPFALLPAISYLLADIGRFGMLLEIVVFAVVVHQLLTRQQDEKGRIVATASRVVGFTVGALVANWVGKVPLFIGIMAMKVWLS